MHKLSGPNPPETTGKDVADVLADVDKADIIEALSHGWDNDYDLAMTFERMILNDLIRQGRIVRGPNDTYTEVDKH